MTFSIIGFDPEKQMIGSAVASKWTGVGACVPFFEVGVGFVHMQNHAYALAANKILDQMSSSTHLETCVKEGLRHDEVASKRQCILANLEGDMHVHTGVDCHRIHHQRIGTHCAAAGNMLARKEVVDAMITAFEESSDQLLAERLILALEAGQAEGGDRRGIEAASVRVHKTSYPVQKFFPVDLRVDYHAEPLQALRYLYEVFTRNETCAIG